MMFRRWAIDGKIPFSWAGRERRFSFADVEDMKRGGGSVTSRPRREVTDVRVPGASGQESSLAAQEEGLRAASAGVAVKAVRVRGSGWRENRPGLNRVLAMAGDGAVAVVRGRDGDRLARFGAGRVGRLFAVYGVRLEVLHPERSGGRMNSVKTSLPWSPPSQAGCPA